MADPRILYSRDILDLTEQGAAVGPARRALMLLEASYPDFADVIADVALSDRDRALLALRERLFGAEMQALEICENCGEELTLSLTAEDIGLGQQENLFPPAPSGKLASGANVRAVTARDAALIETTKDVGLARAMLVDRVAPEAADTPELDELLETLDPAAKVEIALECPTCATTTARDFDAASFFWCELEAQASHILRDVTDLARCYHWSEREILGMSAARRAFYLAQG